MQYLRSALLFLSHLSLCATHSAEGACDCPLPTPCKSADGSCDIPDVNDVTQCREDTRDCRGEEQNLCESNIRAKKGWCCWTICSSLAAWRTCGEAPAGFVFNKPGVRNGTECRDPLNVRERCCLYEMKTMKALGRKPGCPKSGSELVKIFETVDGNRASAPNSVISDIEVLNSLRWLGDRGSLFLARNFTDIDIDRNHHLSWYEVELFCGFRAVKLPPTDILQVKPSEITMIASQPLLVAGLLSSLVIGELLGLLQVIAKHLMHLDADPQAEGPLIKGVYTLLAYVWPVTYCAFQLYYWFRKIDWEVCDAPQAAVEFAISDGQKMHSYTHIDPMAKIRAEYLALVLLSTATVAIQVVQWAWLRKCPLSPTKDIERRIFHQQVYFKKHPKIVEYFWICFHACFASWTLCRVVFYGTLLDVDFVGLDACKREEPDLALLTNVNERFFMWRVVQACGLSLYVQLGWGIQNKQEYTRLPDREDLPPNRDDNNALLNDMLVEEKSKWTFFQ